MGFRAYPAHRLVQSVPEVVDVPYVHDMRFFMFLAVSLRYPADAHLVIGLCIFYTLAKKTQRWVLHSWKRHGELPGSLAALALLEHLYKCKRLAQGFKGVVEFKAAKIETDMAGRDVSSGGPESVRI